jgi:pilus assembly protein CpaF
MKPLGFGRRTQTGAQVAPDSGGAPAAIGSGRRSLVTAGEAPRAAPISNKASVGATVDQLYELMSDAALTLLPADELRARSRSDLADLIFSATQACADENGIACTDADIRDAVTVLINDVIDHIGGLKSDPFAEKPAPQVAPAKKAASASIERVLEAKENIFPLLMEHVDASAMAELSRGELADQISDVVGDLLRQQKKNLNTVEQRDLVTLLLNDMLGLGPLEPLLGDEAITDIMVNGPRQVYAERKGKLELTGVTFRDEAHLLNIAQRIVSAVGRRVDETSPICDARLLDGSRVNVIIPPLAIDGTSISIRKFSKRKITLDMMSQQGNIHPKMSQILKIAGRCRLNIVISGGTGSGKTTMLNAVSRNIDEGERVVTIEDAAELQLQQPHVVRLETRPSNLEGNGEITMRDLVKNALRMRPDRIILGEVRGPEAVDLLQAMNTGHDGSLGTLHANRPREALTRLENMVNMAGLNLPPKAIRTQIADAVHLIIQISRMRDGVRRITYITEVVGMEGDVVVTQDLYTFQYQGEDESGKLKGDFVSSGLRPHFYDRAEYYGLGRALMDCM